MVFLLSLSGGRVLYIAYMNEKLSTIEKIGNWFSTLLLGKTKEIIVRMDERINSINNTVIELKSDVKALAATTSAHSADITGLKVHTKYGVTDSPTVPSELGGKLLKDAGFYEIYPELKVKIFALLRAKNLRKLYDYEKEAEQTLEDLRDDPLMDCLKEYAVNHPEESLELIFKVAAWVIRDDFAKEYPIKTVGCHKKEGK